MATHVEVLGPQQVDRQVQEQLAHVFLNAYGDPDLPESALDAEHFATSTVPRHAQRDGFRMVLADVDGEVAGYGYGFTGRRGQYWSDLLLDNAPADVAAAWVGEHFELVDIVVAPDFRGRGVAGEIHDGLVTGLPHERALLATQPDGGAVSRLYEGRGWQVVAPHVDDDKALYGLDLRSR